ncbi:hypothetical protein [Tsukamurella soli]|uniref:Uncharacterized protein n=1 Tax=Tsukamurella soli TaxID=644556 RepID=A0ABP8J666_9ACTN
MRRLDKRWGMLGYVLCIVAIAGLAAGLTGVAVAAPWGWYLFAVGVVLVIAGGALLVAVSVSQRPSRFHDRTERDPIMEPTTPEEEREYVRRYRGRRRPETR